LGGADWTGFRSAPIGHNRLQFPPDTSKWWHVVEALALGEDVAAIADATLSAAERGLELAGRDRGVAYSVWLLARIVAAARKKDFAGALSDCAVGVTNDSSLTDVLAGFSDAVDRKLTANRSRTDLGEMAQMAAVEAVSATAGAAPDLLFGDAGASAKAALGAFGTEAGFRTLTHAFFTRFFERYLTYHLSRELSQHVGQNQRFADSAAHNEFLGALRQHSSQVTSIVREFAAGWFSKSKFETGLSEDSARRFASYCITKIRSEVRRRSAG